VVYRSNGLRLISKFADGVETVCPHPLNEHTHEVVCWDTRDTLTS